MPTPLENLQTAYANVSAQLADITLNPRPTYSLDGESVSWGEHFNNLTAAQEKLRALIIAEEGPAEVHVQGVV